MRKAVRVSLTKVDGRERAVVVDIGKLSKDQVEAMGVIERVASEANLNYDTVIALLSLERMAQEAELHDHAAKKRELG